MHIDIFLLKTFQTTYLKSPQHHDNLVRLEECHELRYQMFFESQWIYHKRTAFYQELLLFFRWLQLGHGGFQFGYGFQFRLLKFIQILLLHFRLYQDSFPHFCGVIDVYNSFYSFPCFVKICFVILEEFLGSDLLCHLLLKYLYNFDNFNNFIVECILLDGVLSSYQFFLKSIFDFSRFSNTRSMPWFQVKFCLGTKEIFWEEHVSLKAVQIYQKNS